MERGKLTLWAGEGQRDPERELWMTGLDLAAGEELSHACEPCLNFIIGGVPIDCAYDGAGVGRESSLCGRLLGG